MMQTDLVAEILNKLHYSEYDIIFEANVLNLAQTVDTKIKEGWRCQGGVAYVPAAEENGLSGVCQAIVK